jgi:hypothetical protein
MLLIMTRISVQTELVLLKMNPNHGQGCSTLLYTHEIHPGVWGVEGNHL